MEEEGLEHYHLHRVLMVEEVGQCEMEEVGHDDVKEEGVEHFWWEGVGLHDCVGAVEAELIQYHDGHHEREEVEVPFVSRPQVVGWPSQFHHAAPQIHR